MGTIQSLTGEGGGGGLGVQLPLSVLLKSAQLFPYTYESRLPGGLQLLMHLGGAIINPGNEKAPEEDAGAETLLFQL